MEKLRRLMLRIVDGFILREIAGTWVVIPGGARLVEFNGIINLSESGALLWKQLQKGADKDDLLAVLLKEYQISQNEARNDVEMFLSQMQERGLIV